MKINKQPEVPENQTAWNSDNHGIKEKSTRTTRLVRWLTKRACWLRKTTVRQQTAWVRLAALRQQTQAVAAVGETPSLTREFIEKWARDERVSCTVHSLMPPPQQRSSTARRVALPR